MNKILIYSFILLLGLTALSYGEEETGGYPGAYLRLSVLARPAAMGGAYTAVSDDGASIVYNPAGLTAIKGKMLVSSYRAMKLDRKMSFVSFLLPTKKESALGLSWQFIGTGSVDVRNQDGDNMGYSMSSNEHIISLTFSKQFAPFLGMGAKLNYYSKDGGTPNSDYDVMYDLGASSVGINLGGLLYVDSLFEYGTMEQRFINDIKVGLVLENMAAKYNWSSKESTGLVAAPEEKFPFVGKLGISFKALKRQLLIAADAEKVEKRKIKFHVGGEYTLQRLFALRVGADDGRLTAGLGYQFRFESGMAIDFSYAFSSDKVGEGDDHLFGFQFRF